MLLLSSKLELLEIPSNYISLISRIIQLSHFQRIISWRSTTTLQITYLANLVMTHKKSNITAGVKYRHPSMNVIDFNENYLNGLLDKISKEEKNISLLGDLNINLLNYHDQRTTNVFLDSLESSSLLPYVI